MLQESWVEKYRPKTLSDIVGNGPIITELREWAQSWEKSQEKSQTEGRVNALPDIKAIILYGKPGTGKSSTAYALANDMGWEVSELNASDTRTKLKIEKIAGYGSRNRTIDGSIRLIILDEADNIYAREDKGGERAVIDIIGKTQQPIILIANEFYDISYELRAVCKSLKYRPIWTSSIAEILKKIAKSENVTYDIGTIERITENSGGDLRGAINDLQAVCEGKNHITFTDIVTGKRDPDDSVFDALKKMFRAKNIRDAHDATDNIDESPEEFINWIAENVPDECSNFEELDGVFYRLSRAGEFLGRVKKQNYNMWKYANGIMTAGVFTELRNAKYTDSKMYRKPRIGTLMWNTKGMRFIRDSLARKIGIRYHTSMGFAREQLFPFFELLMRKNESYAKYIAASLELNVGEIAFIINSKPDASNVITIYKNAQSVLRQDSECIIESSVEIDERVENERIIGKYGKAQMTIEDSWGA